MIKVCTPSLVWIIWIEWNISMFHERTNENKRNVWKTSLSLSLSLSHARNPTTLKINCIEFEWLDCDVIQSLLLPKHSTLFLLASVSPTLQYLSQFYTSELKRWRNQETDIINIKMPLEKIVILKCF
jgi:hypothetical protein